MTALKTVNDYYTVKDLQEALKATDLGQCDTSSSSDETSAGGSLDLDDESERLMVLKSYGIIESDMCDLAFDGYTKLAKEVFDVSFSMICLIDLEVIWTKSSTGFKQHTTILRSHGICNHVLSQRTGSGMLVIKDTLADDRFSQHPMVADGPMIRFYAGAPLVTPEGQKIGVFSIADTKPRSQGLTYTQEKRLRDMASMAVYDIIMLASDY